MGLKYQFGFPPLPLTNGAQIPRVLYPRLVHRGKETDVSILQGEGGPEEDVQQSVSFESLLGWLVGGRCSQCLHPTGPPRCLHLEFVYSSVWLLSWRTGVRREAARKLNCPS